MALQLYVNGATRTVDGVDDDTTVLRLVQALGLTPDRIAVELNGQIARRPAWDATRVAAGDRLEIVHFVGGGCQTVASA